MPGQEFIDFINVFQGLLNTVVPIVIGIAVITMLYGIVKFIRSADQPDVREEGKKIMAYGILALFVMFAMWGFVNLIISTVLPNANDRTLDDVPQSEVGIW